jgi:signal transduction histidine kinase
MIADLGSELEQTNRGLIALHTELEQARHAEVRLEEQLHRAQRLESLGQLAAGIAHEFNNLLGIVTGYTGFVDDELAAAAASDGGGRWESARDDLGQVQRAVERAASLVHQLLAAGRREVNQPRVLDLNQLVTGLEDRIRRAVGGHIELRTRLQPGARRIRADPSQMEQVLVQLAANARDAMPAGGTLTLTTRGGGDDTRVPAVGLDVADTGTGMDAETAAKVFEPFFTTKPRATHSGLGLATVYGIVAQAGGRTQIRSQPGAGTTVTLSFPAVSP